jgi:hypothetical protein
MVAQTSPEREDAQATYPAELQTVGDHTRLDLAAGSSNWIAKPAPGPGNLQATHIQLQALTQNIRYRIDGDEASATVGFQLAAGAISLIPVPNLGISVFEEAAGAIVQYQWVR